MPAIISNISLPFTAPPEEALKKALIKLGNPSNAHASIVRRAIDARKGGIQFVYSVRVAAPGIEAVATALGDPQARAVQEPAYSPVAGDKQIPNRPVIVGFGPAGIFAAHLLAKHGYWPLVLERGAEMGQRVQAVQSFWDSGALDTKSNVQFGEGGAGTFSDGKLTTRIHDPRCAYVLRQFVAHGAPPEILADAKPHIGTDLLRGVVQSMRREIIAMGGEIRFDTCLTSLQAERGEISRVVAGGEEIPADALILATGHSARDTFQMLLQNGIPMEAKPFSVGLRVEHLQSEIDRALYGRWAGHPLLPPGEYQLSHREGGRSVYTFCMCPGGEVVAAASEEGGVVTNGMSLHARDGRNANAALVAGVDSNDFQSGPLGGLEFQRRLEQAAFALGGGGYRAPYSSMGDFLGHKGACTPVQPSYTPGVEQASLASLFPQGIASMLKTGAAAFGKKLRGFDFAGAALTGVETRTSSPVRIPRGEDLQSVGAKGIYPCGEGAGYAGGIMSAAVDGLRCAEAVMSQYRPG